jgi:tol-pal system protein YbgF
MKHSINNNTKAVPSHGAAFVVKALALGLAALVVSSCATKEQVVKVEERVRRLEVGRAQSQAAMNRLDSLVSEASKGKTGDYAKVANLIQSMSDRIDELTNSISDLQERLNFIQSRQGSSDGTVSQKDAAANTAGVDCSQLYDDSFILVRKGEYESARAGFKDYLQYCKNSDMADNAQYWIAESYYSRQQFAEAAKEFTILTEQYTDSEKRPTALYKLGRCSEELGDKSQARQYYNAVVNGYPSTSEAQLAKDKLTELKGSAKNSGGK